MFYNLFDIQELIRNLVSGTDCAGYNLLFWLQQCPDQLSKFRKLHTLQEALGIFMHLYYQSFLLIWGMFLHSEVTLPRGYLVKSFAGFRPTGNYLSLFTEEKSRATRLATKFKTDFKVHSPVAQYTSFKFMDMSGYLRKT